MKTSLTTGNERKALILFSLPMILGNMLQQLYNVADTLIVGKTLGPNALAAVGSSYALMVLLTSIILGLCMGSGVVFAQFYGAKKIEELKISTFNSGVFILGITLVINIVSFLLLKPIVKWLQVPAAAAPFTVEYLRIIFIGMIFVFLFNFIASILRSVGNTVVPLVFLGIAAVVNIVLDIVFIVVFHSGIAGAAIATVIAQGLSAVAITIYYFMKMKNLMPTHKHMHFEKRIVSLIISNSVLTSIQQSIMNFGILMIQGLVNSFGLAATAAFAAVVKIDAFAYMPAQDFGNAFATFIAQNYGAKEEKRMKIGTRYAIQISAAFCIAVSIGVVVCAKQLMLIFVKSSETEIIEIGMQYLRIEGACYLGIGILFLLYGLYRGLGKSQMSIILTVISLGSRVALAYIFAPRIGLVAIWWSIPIGWLLADIVGIYYYIRLSNRK